MAETFRQDLSRIDTSEKLLASVSIAELSASSAEDGTSPQELSHGDPSRLSILESLPSEVLEEILSFLMLDLPPETYGARNEDLVACLLTSKVLHSATLSLLYRNVTIPHSQIFAKMLANLLKHPELGSLVRRLNFSHYTSVGFGRTRRGSSEIRNVKPETLIQSLKLLPNLRELLVHEELDDELDANVLRQIFTMPSLTALDFCASSSRTFVDGMSAAITDNPSLPESLPKLKRLSLHECETLQAPVFESLLPRLVNLTHLDVAHTLITDRALENIPITARITHLNLIRCTRIVGASIVKFLTTHPAVKDTLIYLNLHCDISRYRLLSANDVTYLLSRLPSTLRSLNLTGARVTPVHMPQLLTLSTHLQELGLGFTDLEADNLRDLIFQQNPHDGSPSSTLCYLDLTGIECLTPGLLDRLTSPFIRSAPRFHNYSRRQAQPLPPLLAIEVSDSISAEARKRHNLQEAKLHYDQSFIYRELGRRVVFTKKGGASAEEMKGSGRGVEWKMGADDGWGMRKIPVARQEVGGLYGFYMFKK
ncbi:MAG: hypothetical protein Q9227_000892 [Pyrenula ochraceoflavens]